MINKDKVEKQDDNLPKPVKGEKKIQLIKEQSMFIKQQVYDAQGNQMFDAEGNPMYIEQPVYSNPSQQTMQYNPQPMLGEKPKSGCAKGCLISGLIMTSLVVGYCILGQDCDERTVREVHKTIKRGFRDATTENNFDRGVNKTSDFIEDSKDAVTDFLEDGRKHNWR